MQPTDLENFCKFLKKKLYILVLRVDECRVLGSAKQPLLLTWRNPEILAELTAPTHQLIFKCGDDMRQDML